ncbi:MAG: ribose-phosphate pyrophosphokinase, partial [Bacteroidota bacterium]
IVTDSIPLKQESPKVRVLTCADLFADVMLSVHGNKSISSKFLM